MGENLYIYYFMFVDFCQQIAVESENLANVLTQICPLRFLLNLRESLSCFTGEISFLLFISKRHSKTRFHDSHITVDLN